jgi:hypothetical protein
MSERPARPHRPAPHADLTAIIDAAGGAGPQSRAEVAAATAALVMAVGRDCDGPGLVELADEVGMDTLAALWRDADPVSLPGALWTLYVLRQWCLTRDHEVARLWRAGAALAPAEALVAGVAEDGDADDVRRMGDAVLSRAYRGDFAVALERAAAFFRVIAAGRRHTVGLEDKPHAALQLAHRNERAAADLARAARAWRSDTLD